MDTAWSSRSIKRERQRRRGGSIETEGRGVPLVNQLRVQPANRTRYTGPTSDVRIGIRTPDGNTYMSEETVNETRDRRARERAEDNANKAQLTIERLRRMREGAAKQGALDLPDHW